MSFFQFGACEKIRADHLQAVTARLIGPEHQPSNFKGPLDHGQLALIKLEVDNLPRFGFFARKMPLDLSLELFPGECLGFVHPGCTSELGPISARYLDEFPGLGPADFSKLRLRYAGEMLVNRHEVIGLPPRIGKTLRQEFIK